MCCGVENLSVGNTNDVKQLISSVLKKKRSNRVRRHPSMCVDAILASTLRLLKNGKLISSNNMASEKCRKRTMEQQGVVQKKKSRWDVRYKIKSDGNRVDDELEDMLVLINDFLIPLA